MVLLWIVACAHNAPDPGLSVEQMTSLVKPEAKERKAWAAAVRNALVSAGQVPDASNACQVLAIIEQESTYNPDPPVAGLSKVVRSGIDEKFDKLGPLANPVRQMMLSPIPAGATKSFDEQLSAVRTEQDVDELFRAILAYHEQHAPEIADALHTLFPRRIDSLNPVETAGSMQVSVAWAQDLARREGVPIEEARDLLYTRDGGVKYGTARLFAHETERREAARGWFGWGTWFGAEESLPSTYKEPIYRFADYNAGLYASRNSSFQEAVAKLTGMDLAPDGDLLQWTDGGKPRGDQDGETVRALETWRAKSAPEMTKNEVIRDLKSEKLSTFEETETWRLVRESYRTKFKKDPPYARLPDVMLDSPKLSKELTTSWFATNVDRRYKACMERAKKR